MNCASLEVNFDEPVWSETIFDGDFRIGSLVYAIDRTNVGVGRINKFNACW